MNQNSNIARANPRSFPVEAASKRGITEGIWTALLGLWPTAPSSQVILEAYDTAVARGWDPLKGHVALVEQRAKNQNGEWYSTCQVWPTLKSLVWTAHQTKAFAGMDPVQFGPTITKAFTGTVRDNGRNVDKTFELSFPEFVSCTVYRIVAGQRFPFTETVYFEELAATRDGIPSPVWRTKPRLMLTKCAKSAALRTAFAECDYSADEMDGQSVEMADVVEFTPRPGSAPAAAHAPAPRQDQAQDEPDQTPQDPAADGSPWGLEGNTAMDLPDRADGEAYTSFSQMSDSDLYWLTNALKTAISVKAFGPGITNLKATLRPEAHGLGERLFNAARTIAEHGQSAGMFGYVDKAIAQNAYGQARSGLPGKEQKGMIDARTREALETLLFFHEAAEASAAA